MKKVTLTTIAILTTLTLTACGKNTTEPTNSTTITSTEVSKAHSLASQEQELVDEVYPETSDTEEVQEPSATEEVEENNKVIVPSSYEWFTVKTQKASGFATKVRCENCADPVSPVTMAGGAVYAMTQVTTKDGYSTIKVVNFAQRSNNLVEFILNTNEPGIAQGIAQQFIRYMVNLKPDGKLTNGLASNAQYWLEHDGLTQDLDNDD